MGLGDEEDPLDLADQEDLVDWADEPDLLDSVADSDPLGWIGASDVSTALRNALRFGLPKKKAKTMPVSRLNIEANLL